MNYKRNTKYFTSPWMGKAATLCWVLTAIGVVVVFLRISWVTYSLGGTVAIGSVVAGIILNSISIGDKEYDEICMGLKKKFREKFTEYVYAKLNAANGRGKAPIAVDEDKVALAHAFYYGFAILSRVGQDGRRRSARLLLGACYLDKTAVYIATETHGITEELREDSFGTYPYAEIASIDVTESEIPYAEYVQYTIRLKHKPDPVTLFLSSDAETEKIMNTVKSKITAD